MIDPYVKVKYGDKKNKKTFIKYRSRVIENSQNPTWNELFKFQIADYDSSQILFEVWNDNVVSDDLMGSYSLSLNSLEKGVVKDYWAILTGTQKSSSELHIRILAVDFGFEPASGTKVITSLEDDNLAAPTAGFRPPKKDSNPCWAQAGPHHATSRTPATRVLRTAGPTARTAELLPVPLCPTAAGELLRPAAYATGLPAHVPAATPTTATTGTVRLRYSAVLNKQCKCRIGLT
ncbi:C2 domain containing protein, putative [Angomonas deanei]|uniref:C2 domain containing protein, putative n=1 Tax=Angomonas deanei TaxID=59799 RepID=A0A7G2C2C5_9TRYP|nr:C2 domain containing protein, putative [Angomonas deanei]